MSATPLPVGSEQRPYSWPERLVSLARSIRTADSDSDSDSDALRQEFWGLLHLALRQSIRLQCHRGPRIQVEDLEDLASQKSLELFDKFDHSSWKVESSAPGEVVAFIRTVVRNGLIDHWRRRGREPVELEEEAEQLVSDIERNGDLRPEAPHVETERNEFAEALVECASLLSPRDRTVWFFRVFYDLPSRVIAEHPEIRLKPSHVDVILQRSRTGIRDCMRKKGFETDTMPAGTFATLWMRFRAAGLVRKEGGDA